ncbi:hypothetical protein Tco_1344919 [Tanacetum coccineum]
MKKENMSIEEMMREQLMVDDEIKDISNYLSYKRFRGEKIDDEYERDCEIKIEQLLQDYNGLGIEIRKKERILMEEKSLAVSRRIQSICDDDDEYSIQTQEYLKKFSSTITPVLPIEEPDNSLSMGDEHLDTIPSVENLVPIPSEFEGISDDTYDVPVCDDSSTFDALNDHSEILSNSNDDGTSSDDDDFEDIKYVSLEEIEPDQEGLISIDNSNEPLLELPEFESFHFDPSFPRPPPEPLDVEICLHFKPGAPVIDNFNELMMTKGEVRLIFLKMLKMTIPSHLSTPRFLFYLAPPGVKIRSLTPASSLRAGGISFASPRTN